MCIQVKMTFNYTNYYDLLYNVTIFCRWKAMDQNEIRALNRCAQDIKSNIIVSSKVLQKLEYRGMISKLEKQNLMVNIFTLSSIHSLVYPVPDTFSKDN